MAKIAKSVVGLDIDQDMCLFAKNTYHRDNLDFICEEEFNKIVSFATLSWIPVEYHQQIFLGIFKALKKKGTVLIRMSSEGERPLNKALDDVSPEEKWRSFFINYKSPASYQSETMLRSMIKDIGFKEIRIQDVTKTCYFNDKKEFSNWLLTWIPQRNVIPTDLRNNISLMRYINLGIKHFKI